MYVICTYIFNEFVLLNRFLQLIILSLIDKTEEYKICQQNLESKIKLRNENNKIINQH